MTRAAASVGVTIEEFEFDYFVDGHLASMPGTIGGDGGIKSYSISFFREMKHA